MRIPRVAFFLLSLFLVNLMTVSIFPFSLSVDQIVEIPNTLPSSLGKSVTKQNRVPELKEEQISIVLKPRNETIFEQLAFEVQDPKSLNYRKFLSKEDYERQFAPEKANYDAIKKYFISFGLATSFESKDRLLLSVKGTRDQLDKAFNTNSELRENNAGFQGFVNISPLFLPASFNYSIKSIVGFDSLNKFQILSPLTTTSQTTGTATINTAATLRKAYSFPSNLDGSGVKVGILHWCRFLPYEANRWLAENFPASGYTVNYEFRPDIPSPSCIQNSDIDEANLDVQMVLAAAPNAKIMYYLFDPSTLDSLLTTLDSAIADGINVLSSSISTCEYGAIHNKSAIDGIHVMFTKAALAGIPIFFPSGDDGIFFNNECQTIYGGDGAGLATWPASDSLVTAVGGTTLYRDSQDYYAGEQGWSCSNYNDLSSCLNNNNNGSSGGGISTYFNRPAYQMNIISPLESVFPSNLNINSKKWRVLPDISINADHRTGIRIATRDCPISTCDAIGGTSTSAPLLAGIAALATQRYGGNVGGLNPFLYANQDNNLWLFDVSKGFNGVSAKPGWDYVTGLGSIWNVNVFIEEFVTAANTAPGWVSVGDMSSARTNHQSALLISGKVLVVGGSSDTNTTAEMYDPVLSSWSSTGSLVIPRTNFSLTSINNGKNILVVGGSGSDPRAAYTAEIYDSDTGSWTLLDGSTNFPHTGGHSAVLLGDGRILISGGRDVNLNYTRFVEIYNPSNNTWTVTGSLGEFRANHVSTLLDNNKVLITGGYNSNGPFLTASLFDPITGLWSSAGNRPACKCYLNTATKLKDGKVLVVGGYDGYYSDSSAHLYDPNTNTWSILPPMMNSRLEHSATLLKDGRVLIAGGERFAPGYYEIYNSAEIYDPSNKNWSSAGNMSIARASHQATLLFSGQVLVEGGYNYSYPQGFSSANLFTSDAPLALVLKVNLNNDDGKGNTPGSLSYAIKHSRPGDTIAIDSSSITITSPLPPLPVGVTLIGGQCNKLITINGSALSQPVLSLAGQNTVIGISIVKGLSQGIKTLGSGNFLKCVDIHP